LEGTKTVQKLRKQLEAQIGEYNKVSLEARNTIRRLDKLSSSKERKQKVDKLTQDFEKFNEQFAKLVRVAKEKMGTPVHPERYQMDVGGGIGNLYSDTPASDHLQQGLLYGRRDELVEDDLEFQNSIVRERDNEIRAIQGQMVEVNEIFRDLAKLVEDQGEMIDNIQTSIITAATNVDDGVKAVIQADSSQQSTRKKLCFLAVIITIIIAIVIVVVVLVHK